MKLSLEASRIGTISSTASAVTPAQFVALAYTMGRDGWKNVPTFLCSCSESELSSVYATVFGMPSGSMVFTDSKALAERSEEAA